MPARSVGAIRHCAASQRARSAALDQRPPSPRCASGSWAGAAVPSDRTPRGEARVARHRLVVARGAEAGGREHGAREELGVGGAARAFRGDREELVAEVAIGPAAPRATDDLRAAEPGEDRVRARLLTAAGRVARCSVLETGRVVQEPPDGEAGACPGGLADRTCLRDEPFDRVVELERARVTQGEDRGRGEGLRDRGDAEACRAVRGCALCRIRDAAAAGPRDPSLADDPRGHPGGAGVAAAIERGGDDGGDRRGEIGGAHRAPEGAGREGMRG